MINLTEEAQNQITKLCTEEYDIGIRLEVVSGGCSGYQYKFTKMALIAEDREKDVIVGAEGAALYIDYTLTDKIDGATIDYVSDIISEQFVVNNPNSLYCGCGKSFS